jgi:hypothetical protein
MFTAAAVGVALVVAVVLLRRRRNETNRPTARHAQPFAADASAAVDGRPDEQTRRPRRGAHAMPVAPRGPDDDEAFIAQLAQTLRTRRSDPDAQ